MLLLWLLLNDWVTTEYCFYPAVSDPGYVFCHCSERLNILCSCCFFFFFNYPVYQIWIMSISLMSYFICLSKHIEATIRGFGRRSEYSPPFSQFVIGDEYKKPHLWISLPVLLHFCCSINPKSENEVLQKYSSARISSRNLKNFYSSTVNTCFQQLDLQWFFPSSLPPRVPKIADTMEFLWTLFNKNPVTILILYSQSIALKFLLTSS